MTEDAIEAAANAMLALERENARPSHLDYARVAVDAACPRLVAEIERLDKYLDGQVRYYNEQRQKDLVEIERLRKEIERLRRIAEWKTPAWVK